MNHHGEAGWYPECKKCGSGNLGSNVVCLDCYNELIDKVQKELNEMKKLLNS